jgi:hypothetical protein
MLTFATLFNLTLYIVVRTHIYKHTFAHTQARRMITTKMMRRKRERVGEKERERVQVRASAKERVTVATCPIAVLPRLCYHRRNTSRYLILLFN